MLEMQPELSAVMDRYEAWWDCAVVDRPLVAIKFPVAPAERQELPRTKFATLQDRWLDAEYQAVKAEAQLRNTVHYADSLPVAWPNLGPEVFSAFYGCPLEFGEDTVWSIPVLADWLDSSLERLCLDENGFYFRHLLALTEALIEKGKGRFIVGYTDLHPGGDAIAAFRDPQELLLDVIERPQEIKRLCDKITGDFIRVYDLFYERLAAAGMPSTTWLPATCRGKYHVASNDFSCMISEAAFTDLFLPGIIRECRHMDRCIYHLDGPQALRYLDLLLDIPEIHAVQWVFGAGNGKWSDWIEVYQRIQARRKALQISLPAADLDMLFEVLSPEGVWISSLGGISNHHEAESALKKIAGWTKRHN